ncbi:Acetolactate synthase large subunit IlvG [bacterium HR25]|nr:Acetolactate synthase large subunit IlvG [bacterium HR25]
MARLHGGEMVARVLRDVGVRELFTLQGGHIDPILEACDRFGFRIIDTRHEQAAAHMAEGWARTTGRLGVCAVTAGPGITDAITGIANAYLDAVPMLVLAGRSPLADEDLLPLQGMPQLEMVRPITKWARTVYQAPRIAEYVAMAVRQATTGRPGPVYLEVPIDVLFASVEEEQVAWPAGYLPEHPPAPRPEAVEAALEMLQRAERPVVLAGGGVWFAGAADELRQFAEITQTPVFMNPKARGCVPEDTPLGYGGFGLFSSSRVQREAGPPDLVMLMGARPGLFTGGRRSVIPAEAKVIQVDIEGEEIGRGRPVDLGIQGDCREVLRQLVAGARSRRWPDRSHWLRTLDEARRSRQRAFPEALQQETPPIHPFRLAHELAQRLGPEDVVVADGGEAAEWIAAAATMRLPGRFLGHGYLGCLGTGLPFAMAAKLARPEARVLLVTGDGSVGLNFAEFETAVRHRLPFVCVIFNDKAWGMSRHAQQILFQGRTIASELGLVHYERAAAGFGCHGELIERPQEIGPALERAFATGLPACLNVLIDPEVVSPVTLSLMGLSAKAQREKEKAEEEGKTTLPYYGQRELQER